MSDESQLQQLRDREEIRQLVVDYATHLDANDHAAYASLFADDGVLDAPLGRATGPAAIERILDETRGHALRDGPPKAIHVLNNHQADLDGDRATAETIWFYLTTDADGAPTVLQAGRYVDQLVRKRGVWKLARHDITRLMGRSPRDPAPPTALDDLVARVQRLEDRESIWRLFMTYNEHLDHRNFEAYASLFTEDGEWIGNLGKAVGPEQVAELLRRTVATPPSGHEQPHHLVLDPLIDVDGDTATACSNWVSVGRDAEGAPVVSMLGRYLDQLRRTADGWRFSRRVTYSDVPYLDISEVKARPAPYIDPRYQIG